MLASGVQVADAIYLDANAGNDLNDGKSNDTAVQTLEKAYELAEDGDTIYLLSDIESTATVTMSGNKSVILEGIPDNSGNIPEIKCENKTSAHDLYMLEIGEETGAPQETNITITNLKIDANENDIRCVRICPGAELTLEYGATVCNGRAVSQTNSTGPSDLGGGIVVDSDARLVMEEGSSITGCSAEWGGAVYLSGEMEINGGEISNNTAVGDIGRFGITEQGNGGAIAMCTWRAD